LRELVIMCEVASREELTEVEAIGFWCAVHLA
jgi:hypothetical protein